MGFLIIGFGLIALLCLFRGYFFLKLFFLYESIDEFGSWFGLFYFILTTSRAQIHHQASYMFNFG